MEEKCFLLLNVSQCECKGVKFKFAHANAINLFRTNVRMPLCLRIKWVFNTYVDAVLVRLVIIGLGNCNCELFRDLFGELSGDDIFNFD